jgi:hypothetical protein
MGRTGDTARGTWLLRFVQRHPDVPAFYRVIAQREMTAMQAASATNGGDRQLRNPFGHGLVEITRAVLDELPTADRRTPTSRVRQPHSK